MVSLLRERSAERHDLRIRFSRLGGASATGVARRAVFSGKGETRARTVLDNPLSAEQPGA
jgi:hypothetical protein